MQRQITRRAAGYARWVGICFWSALALQSAAVYSQVAVSESGQPSYSVPIAVPPGPAGLEPKLSLQYSRGAQGGPFAVGWSLGGLSVITRCAWTQATDGQRRGVKYTAEDRYCLDGQKLLRTNTTGVGVAGQGGYGAPNTEFRTEKDSYARIRALGATETGPQSFKVWTKSGLIYEYGTVPNPYGTDPQARIQTTGRTPAVTMAWAVNRISDTAGNYMDIYYNVQPATFAGSAGTEWEVAAIYYSGSTPGGSAPTNKVEFVYEPRPDATEAYHEGAKSVTTRRLSAIRTHVGVNWEGTGGVLVQTLKLNYTTGLNSTRSLLASTQVCGGPTAAKCLPKTEYTYAAGPGGSFAPLQHSSLTAATLKNALGTRGVYQGDFNGDGRQDLLVWDEIPSQSALMLSNGDGSFSAPPQPLPAVQFGHSGGCHYAIVADFNVDGVSDVLQVSDPDYAPDCASVPRAARIYIGSTSGVFQPAVNVTQAGGAALPLVRTDPLYSGGQPACYGADSCEGFTPTSITKAGRSFYVADLNGDGVPDILVTNSLPGSQTNPATACASGERSCVFTGSAQTVGVFTKVAGALTTADLFSPRSGPLGLPPELNGTYKAERLFLGDINSDGLPDIVMRDSGKRYLGNGAASLFTEASGTATQCIAGAEVLDVNGDGKWDLACMDYAKPDPYTVHINNGTGAFTARGTVSNWTGRSCTSGSGANQTPTPCDTSTRGHILYLGADYDGDGISDMLALGRVEYARPGSRNAFLKGQRNGSFLPISVPTLDSVELASGGNDVLIGDFMGRGSIDILRMSLNPGTNALYTRSDMLPADVLVSVKAPGGAESFIDYKPLTDADVYTRSTGAVYPVVDFAGAQWVVSTVRAPNGRGGQISSTFKYGGQRADLTGRGSLGFRTMEQTAPGPDGTPITSRTLYRQDYPFVGLPQETRRYVQFAGEQSWLSLTSSTYGDLHTLGCSGGTSPRIYRPVLLTSNEQTRDLNGMAMATVVTTNAGYSCYADPGTITVRTSDPLNPALEYTKVTTNQYLAPNIEGDAWLLGRLSSAKQTNTVPIPSWSVAP